MEIYQHDNAGMFRFVLCGELAGASVQELEHAWRTASPVTKNKEVVVDVAGLRSASDAGMELLLRMRASGARLAAAGAPKSQELLATPAARGWKVKLLGFVSFGE